MPAISATPTGSLPVAADTSAAGATAAAVGKAAPSPAPASPAPPGSAVWPSGVPLSSAAADVAMSFEAPAVTDTFASRERGATPARETRPLESQAAEKVSNPFAAWREERRAEPPARRLVEAAIGLETAIETPLAALSALAEMQGRLVPAQAEGCGRIRLGTMLLAADAKGSPLPNPAALQSVSEKVYQGNLLAGHEEFSGWVRQNAAQLWQTQTDINAVVQRVLREAYLLGSEQLADYASKVKHGNEVKKKIRDQLDKARKAQAAWAQERQGGDASTPFVASQPFVATEIDEVTGEAFVPELTAEEAAAAKKKRQGKAPAGAPAADPVLESYATLSGESRLTVDQVALLDRVKKDKDNFLSRLFDSENDDFICDHIKQLATMVPAMNKRELDIFFRRMILELQGGNTDEKEIVKLCQALSPAQAAYVRAAGFDLCRNLGDNAQADIEQSQIAAAQAVADCCGLPLSGPPDSATAAALLAALEKKQAQPAPVPAAAPELTDGAPRTLATEEELDGYIKKLEEQLTSVGDTSQLDNTDLQNELQKQQQLLQMMSNMSRMMHETAKAIIQKVGT
jgi:hypothetical protein